MARANTTPPRNVLADTRAMVDMFDLPEVEDKNMLTRHVMAAMPPEVRLGGREPTVAEGYSAVMTAAIRLRAVSMALSPTEFDLSSRVGTADAVRQEGGRTTMLKELRDQLRLVREISGMIDDA